MLDKIKLTKTNMELHGYEDLWESILKGGLPDGCTTFRDTVVTREGNTINIEVTTQGPKDAICTEAYGFFGEKLNLGSDFTRGATYILKVNDYPSTFEMPL
mgnify:CR=1 FL=1